MPKRKTWRRLPAAALEYFRKQGAKGGKIGGKRRFAPLSAEERSAIARRAALARWRKKRGT